MARHIWAMRTSRNSDEHRNFIRRELEEGRLRQGWGTLDAQDLKKIDARLVSEQYEALTDEEKSAWGHSRLLGEIAQVAGDVICIGHLVLVPNMPDNGTFTICRVTGPYEYGPANHLNDLRHIRPVEILTPGGVANTSELVASELRGSLTCRSRLWSLHRHSQTLDAIIERFKRGDGASLRTGTDHFVRARRAVDPILRETLNTLAAGLGEPLRGALGKAEWEHAIVDALAPLVRGSKVVHTGGPAEEGADLEIHYPNPFDPMKPWIVAVQVKDYQGEVPETASAQLEQAIVSRTGDGAVGRLVAVLLASTSAPPCSALENRMKELSDKYNIAVSCVYGSALMRTLARGFFLNWEDGTQ